MNALAEKIERMSVWEPMSGCRLWLGAQNGHGYGRLAHRNKWLYAHRVAWEIERGPIPHGLQVDHLCRVRSCCNPAHLRIVTGRANTLAGEAPSAKHARKTHCPRGHAYDHRRPSGRRRCRQCDSVMNAAYAATHPRRKGLR